MKYITKAKSESSHKVYWKWSTKTNTELVAPNQEDATKGKCWKYYNERLIQSRRRCH